MYHIRPGEIQQGILVVVANWRRYTLLSLLLFSCSVESDSFPSLAPLSVEFSKQEYWSGLPFPSAGDLPIPRIGLRSPALQADSLLSEPSGKPLLYKGKVINNFKGPQQFHLLCFIFLLCANQGQFSSVEALAQDAQTFLFVCFCFSFSSQ